MVWNMIQMPTKSRPPSTKPLIAIIQNEAGYVSAALVHITAMSR